MLNLQSLDINNYHILEKNKLNLMLNSPKQKYNYFIKNYLNTDGVNPGYQKIIKLLKKI